MNMLIAVMSTPFGEVMEKKDLFKFKQYISIIVDYIDLIDIKNEFTAYKYIIVVKPEEIKVEQNESDKDFIIN
jgi:hypothetical protein